MTYIASDHNGVALKEHLKTYLAAKGYAVEDCHPGSNAGDDYPSIAKKVARLVQKDPKAYGILICGSGNGMVMAANRFRGIRAALVPSPQYAYKARTDEDANILVLPAWWVTQTAAERIVRAWFATRFTKVSRYQKRIRQLDR